MHMKTEHRSRLTDAQLRLLADKNGRTIGPLFESCPLCGIERYDGNIEEHIVGHLRLLAIRSLPACEDEGPVDPDSTSESSSLQQSRSTVRDALEDHAQENDNHPWALQSAYNSVFGSPSYSSTQGLPRRDSLDGKGISDILTVLEDPAHRPRENPIVVKMDPVCAICKAPADIACLCEAEDLEKHLRQAEENFKNRLVPEPREWVRNHAQAHISREFKAAQGEAAKAGFVSTKLAKVEKTDDIGEPEDDHIKAKIDVNEVWSETYQTYPQTLEYFYSLIEFELPGDDEPAVREPPPIHPKGHQKPQHAQSPASGHGNRGDGV